MTRLTVTYLVSHQLKRLMSILTRAALVPSFDPCFENGNQEVITLFISWVTLVDFVNIAWVVDFSVDFLLNVWTTR